MPLSSSVLYKRVAALLVMVMVMLVSGCNSSMLRSDSKDFTELEELADVDDRADHIGELAVTVGMSYIKVESVGVVSRLNNTGSAPQPGPMESQLIAEMQTHQVEKPRSFLADRRTAMVMVTGYLRPGIRKGQRFDLQVSAPRKSDTSSLRGGWLMGSRLREYQEINNSVHTGHVTALAEGAVMVDSAIRSEQDAIHETRGRILGGGISQISRPLGLAVRSEHKSVMASKAIADAINRRFAKYEAGSKLQVATPKKDNYIELQIPSRYRHNLSRYRLVLRGITVGERPGQRADRMMMLEKKLLEPTTAHEAALFLEAIGKDAIPSLRRGLQSPDLEVRFYAAEALAYLDEAEAAEVLGEIAVVEPAFRWHTLTALSAMDHISAYDVLTKLLHVDSAETRYGAFQSLRVRNPHGPVVSGERLGDFNYHVVSTSGPPMIHVRRTKRAELVAFGHDIRFDLPDFVYAGRYIVVRRDGDGIRVSHFKPGHPDRVQRCGRTLNEVVRAIATVGGGYVEVLEGLRNAKKKGFLPARFVVEAQATPNRQYDRESAGPTVAHPIPELFSSREEGRRERPRPVSAQPELELGEEPRRDWEQEKGVFAKMRDWFGGKN